MHPPTARVSRPDYRRYRWIATALIAAIAVIAVAGMALASSTPTLSIARHVSVAGATENVVASSRGLTVYALSGESTRHLKCTKANGCFAAWIPVTTTKTTRALTPNSGIHGALGELRRNGFRQITLGGRPLYTFIGDGGKARRTTGEGIPTFGGVWHVVAAARSRTTTPSSSSTTTSSSTTSNPYPGYP